MTTASKDLVEFPIKRLQILVDVRVGDAHRFEDLARWWLIESRSRLAAELWCLVETGSAGREAAAVARIGIRSMGDGNWSRPYTRERFERLLDSLFERGQNAVWQAGASPGEVGVDECCSAYVSFAVVDGTPEWVTFQARLVFRTVRAGLGPTKADSLVDFVADFAALAEASFGNIADDNQGSRTALEVFLPRSSDEAIRQSLDVLRGYSWVTVCPPSIVQRLGGVGALERSSSFAEVRPLHCGAVLLRATESFDDYDDMAMTKVFHTLAPVLPPGRPRRLPVYEGQAAPRLVYEDAARFCDSPCN